MTRAMLATALVRAISLSTSTIGRLPFSDIAANSPLTATIRTAVTSGIIASPSPTTFGPDDPVSRQEFAASLARALHLSTTTPTKIHILDEAQIAKSARDAVASITAKRYLPIFPDQTSRPTVTITREQAAQALFLALKTGCGPGRSEKRDHK